MSIFHSKRWSAVFVVLVFFSLNLPLVAMASNSENGRTLPQAKGNFRQGEVLVKFKKDRVDVSRFFGRLTVKSFELTKGLERKEILEPQNLTLMKSRTSETTEQLIARLKNDPRVEYVEPNYIRHFAMIPNDTDFQNLLGLNNTANDADIDAPEAWDIYTGGAAPVVAVLDTGVAYNHPDLVNNMWNGSSQCIDDSNNFISGGCPNHGFDFVNNDNDPIDDHGHGTHVAGTIGAEGNNNRGVTGVNWTTKIMAVKVGTANGIIVSDWIKGLNFAKNNGARIANASFSGPEFSQAERDAIASFPGLFIAAAGNDGMNNESSHHYPSDYDAPNIIAVAATDENDNLANFSNFGTTSVDVAAPGVNIESTYPVFQTSFFEDFDGLTIPSIGSQFTASGDSNNWGTFGQDNKVLFTDLFNTPYANNADTSVTSNSIDLSGKAGAKLSFDIACDTDITSDFSDYLALDVSNGSAFTEIQRFDEVALGSGNLYNYSTDLAPFLNSQAKFRFRWITDGSNLVQDNYEGCSVDNVEVNAAERTGENYEFLDGTSMAAPHVAGEAAMILGYNPSLTAAQVKSIIETTGDAKASLAGKVASGKRINLFNALNIFQPRGGFDVADSIPASQISQDTDGSGMVKVHYRVQDGVAGLFIDGIVAFQYSLDGGATFADPPTDTVVLSLPAGVSVVSSTDFTGPDYSFSILTKMLAGLENSDENDVVIRFKLLDGVQLSPYVTSEQFRVNNTTPTATLTNTPANPTNINSIDITVGGTNVVSYSYNLNGFSSGGGDGKGGIFRRDIAVDTNIQWADLADATYTLSVFGKDAQGNVLGMDALGNVNGLATTIFSWLLDTTGPSGTIMNSSGNPTNDQTPTLNLTIADAGVGISGAQMQFSCDPETSWTDFEPFQETKTDFNVSSGLNGCATGDGDKTVYAQLKDSLGNIGKAVTDPFVLNTGEAAIAQFTATPSNPSSDKNPQFTVGGTDIVAYKFQIDNGGFSEETGILSNIQLSNLSDGNHTIQIIGINNAGTLQDEASPTSFTWLLDTTEPALAISPQTMLVSADGSLSTSAVTPTLVLSMSDAGVGVLGATIRFSCDAATWTDFEPFQSTKNNFNIRSGLNGCTAVDGAKTVFAQARDSLLNLGQVANTAEFSLDTTAPDITGLTSDTLPTKSKTWDWNSSDASAVFRFSIDQSETGTPTGAYVGIKSTPQSTGNGTFYLHVQSKDVLDNESSVTTVSAVLDNTAPTATLANLPNNPTNSTSINVTVGQTDVTHYKFKIDAGSFGSETPVSTAIALADLSIGEHTLEVIGRDIAGNYQAEDASTRVTWTVVFSGGAVSGGVGGGPPPTTIIPPNPARVLGAKTELFTDGTIVKLRGKKQYYLIKNGERKLLSLAAFKKKYSNEKVIVLDKKTLNEIPMMKKARTLPKPLRGEAGPTAKIASSAKNFIEISFPLVRVRDGIGYSAKILDGAKKGERFKIVEEKNGWYGIVWKNGEAVWIEGKWVKKTD